MCQSHIHAVTSQWCPARFRSGIWGDHRDSLTSISCTWNYFERHLLCHMLYYNPGGRSLKTVNCHHILHLLLILMSFKHTKKMFSTPLHHIEQPDTKEVKSMVLLADSDPAIWSQISVSVSEWDQMVFCCCSSFTPEFSIMHTLMFLSSPHSTKGPYHFVCFNQSAVRALSSTSWFPPQTCCLWKSPENSPCRNT